MKIIYSKKAEKQIRSASKNSRDYSSEVRRKILSSINYIENADSSADLSAYIPFRLERLVGNRKDEWSIRVGNTGYRLIIVPCGDDEEPLIDGDVLKNCRKIKIVLIKEVSKHYE